jgi:aspartyl-tRNA(Asn)/glutamyl-tRNA(Gln) amidotransferase subunit A
MRFGTSSEGLPINVQIVGKWQAETTVLHVASLLESVSPTRGMHPQL